MIISMNEHEHSKYSPSSAERIINCPASVKLSEGIKSVTSAYAQEGIESHKNFEQAVKNYFLGQSMIEFKDEEEQQHIAEAIKFIHDSTKHLANRSYWTEVKMQIASIDKDCFGTADVVVSAPFQEVFIFDWKWGQFKKVEAKDNYQLMAYLAGVLTNEDGSLDESYEKIHYGVIQPRMANVELVTVEMTSLKEFIEKFKDAIAQAKIETECKEGHWCRWCPASKKCPAKHRAFFEVSVATFDKLEKAQEDEKLIKILSHKKKVVKLLKDIEEHLLERLKKGEKIEGIKLGKGKKVKSWLGPAETLLHDVPYAWKKELIGVTALEKLLKKNKSEIKLDEVVQVGQSDKVELASEELEEYDEITE